MFSIKSILLALFLFLLITPIDGQVTGAKYKIEFNESTTLYDCKLVIIDGSTSTVFHRIQFNAQYTIVVPTGCTFEIAELHMPLVDNQNHTSTTPMKWTIGSIITSPISQSESDFYSITPSLAPTALYNDLQQGDEVTLFSLRVLGDEICDRNIRPFNIETDPSSADDGMAGGDFRNGFTIGGINQIYAGNEMPSTAMKADIADINICSGECTMLSPDIQCMSYPFTYLWSTGENTKEIEICPTENETYTLTVTDGNGESSVLQNTITIMNETDGCTLTSSKDLVLSANIYPNPTASILHIEASKSIDRVMLYDMTGKLIIDYPSSGNTEAVLDISNIKMGLYSIQIVSGETNATRLVVKIGS